MDGSVEAELNQAWRTAFEELDATVPGGKKFSSSLVNVLRREANWVRPNPQAIGRRKLTFTPYRM